MIQQIRPYRVFNALSGLPMERIAHAAIPCRRGLGIRLLETYILIACGKLVAARRVFEFGTWLGQTSLNLALNLPEDGHLFTLDRDNPPLDCAGMSNVTPLVADSKTFDFSPYLGSMDLIWIDGGHDRETVERDTATAFSMVPAGKPACIAWHDYRNPEQPGVTACLDQLALTHPLFYVEDTHMVLWFGPASRDIVQRIEAQE